MHFDPQIAERRFGYGLSPRVAAPEDVQAMLTGTARVDPVLAAYPLPSFRELQDLEVRRRRFAGFAARFRDTAKGKEAYEESQRMIREMREERDRWCLRVLQRRAATAQPFAERLARTDQSPETLARFVIVSSGAVKHSAAAEDDLRAGLRTLQAAVLALVGEE